MTENSTIYFISKPCSDLTDKEIELCSDLFSNHYGKYTGVDGRHKKGDRIKLGKKYYSAYKEDSDMYVSLLKKCDTDEVVGQAFFLKVELKDVGYCSWVTQLLVHSQYRKRGYSKKLLQSAWGFSNYYAWGLATGSCYALKTLESVTWRKIDPSSISENLQVIEKLCTYVSFAKFDKLELNSEESQIFTNFYPELVGVMDLYVTRLGDLRDGYEWLAFTFQKQSIVFEKEEFDKMLNFSMEQLTEAYGRMDMSAQGWTKGTVSEVNYLIDTLGITRGISILDLGCGQGRHSIELAKRGYKVTGVDFSENLLKYARSQQDAGKVEFIQEDARKFKGEDKFDIILCLYDVIGSFRDDVENQKIIKSIKKNLKKGGKAIISVMNMELTEAIAKYKGSVREDPDLLFKLPASEIMSRNGNIFNPDYYVLDTKDRLVYRKEQFDRDGFLSAEYLIADKRYTAIEISALFRAEGFSIISSDYVRAGNWHTSLAGIDKNAKEILLVVEG